MPLQNVISTVRDPKKGVTYNVVAYRKLAKEEIIEHINHYFRQDKAKEPNKGDVITIYTITGHDAFDPQ